MNTKSFLNALTVASLGIAGGILQATAFADEPEITVSAERANTRLERPVQVLVGRTDHGWPIIETEITQHVGFDDLDLTTDSGAAALKQRVRDLAQISCRQVDLMYSEWSPNPACVGDAMKEADPQIDAAISQAKAKVRSKSAPTAHQ